MKNNRSHLLIQSNKNNATTAVKNIRSNCSKVEKNRNGGSSQPPKTIQKIQTKTDNMKKYTSSNCPNKTNNFNDVYALAEVESITNDQSNSFDSQCLEQQSEIINEGKSNKTIECEEIKDNTNYFKSDVKIDNENIYIKQDLGLKSHNILNSIQNNKNNTFLLDQIDFSTFQPSENSQEDDSFYENQLSLFLKNGSIPDSSQQQPLIHYIQRQKVNAIISNNFREASKLQSASKNLINAINSSQHCDTLIIRIEETEKKINETNQQINELNNKIKAEITTERSHLQQKKEEIINKQETELDQFEERWNDEEFLRKFTKPSSTLMAKQSVQHSYVLMKDFIRAEELNAEIRSMEKLESREAQNKAEEEMQKEQKKLIGKHENEIIFFDEFAKRQIETIKTRNETKLEPLMARKRKLETELNSLKKLKAEQINSPSIPIIQNRSQSELDKQANSSSTSSRLNNKTSSYEMRINHANSALEYLMTPRTIQRYSSYKKQIINPKITLKPLGKVLTQKEKKKIISRNRIDKIQDTKF